jgi:hypothetical protein
MKATNLTRKVRNASRDGMARLFIPLSFAPALGACVQVSAPDRPIEINLNINIRQEVVVRLQQDAQELIRTNEGIF